MDRSDKILALSQLPPTDDNRLWFVAHTKPRCEKKLAFYCSREAVPVTLPLYRSVKRYTRKIAVFWKPLFPGYVFLRLKEQEKAIVLRSGFIANLLKVSDQKLFENQLADILFAVHQDVEIRLSPTIGPGCWVRIKSGPLAGLVGWVEHRSGLSEVLLRLDFIGQAAAVRVEADMLELI